MMADSKRSRVTKREGFLMARLSAKEQEVYELQASARDLYRARRPVTDFARQVYTDPAINVEFQLMTAQLAEMENSLRLKDAELKELRTLADKDEGTEAKKGDGAASKPADSAAGGGGGKAAAGGESKAARASALVARCQRLEQENEELAASADVAKVAQLTSEKAVAEAYAGELKTALEEAYEYIEQLEEEREVNSGKVYALEEELRSVASQSLHAQQDDYQMPSQDVAEEDQKMHLHPGGSQEDVHSSWSNPPERNEMHAEQGAEEHQEGGGGGVGMSIGVGALTRGDDDAEHGDSAPPPPPPPPPPPQETADDMDDLYGDIGGEGLEDIGGGVSPADDGGYGGGGAGAADAAAADDPMEEEEEVVQKVVKVEKLQMPTRARSTRKTRSRK